MKKSFCLAVALLAWFQPQAAAQTPSSVQVTPCPTEASVSRPSLKRRAPQPDAETTRQQQPSISNEQPCHTVLNNTGSEQTPVEIRLEGLITVSESDVRTRMRELRLIPKSFADADAIAKGEDGIKQIFFGYGFRRAQVSSRIEQRAQRPSELIFIISEGPRFRISEIRFEGNRVFPSQVLTANVSRCLAPFDEDSRYRVDSDLIEYCLHRLTNFVRSQGYLRARFAEPKIQEVGEALEVTVPSNEGVLYRLGNLEIEGADHVAEQDIRKMIGIPRGDIANGEKISKTLYEELKAIYGEKGFIQYTAEIQPEFHNPPRVTDGIVDLKITIDEGRRFRIRKIAFKGGSSENDLRQMLLLREGDVYNQKLFEESVNKMNETGSFNWVDKDKDVDYRTNDEEGLVDLVITVTRQRPM